MTSGSEGAVLLDAARSRRDEWLELVVRLATFESPSGEPAAQRAIQGLVAAELEELGFRVRRSELGKSGVPCLLSVPRSRRKGAYQLLLGHTDTVWPIGTLRSMPVDSMPVEMGHGVIRGPGVFDMKAGIANVVIALRVLRDLALEPTLPPVLFLNSDEETGSRASSPLVRRLARGASRAFVLEPALGPDGRLKTARMGTGSFVVRVRGKSAHAGLDPERGASAVHEIARVIGRIAAISDTTQGVHLNVGTTRGGTRANVVAEYATGEVDLRFSALDDGLRVVEQMRAIEAESPGCRVEIDGGVERPPMERTPRNVVLWTAAREAANEMGLPLTEASVGGASDGNTASVFTATLDGLGAVGDGAHAADEHVRVEPTLERAALLARLLLLPPLDARSGSADSVESGEIR